VSKGSDSNAKLNEVKSDTYSDFIISGVAAPEEFIDVQNEGNLMIIEETEGDNSKHSSLRKLKKIKENEMQGMSQSSKEISSKIVEVEIDYEEIEMVNGREEGEKKEDLEEMKMAFKKGKNEDVMVETQEDVVVQEKEDVVVKIKEDIVVQTKEDVIVQEKEDIVVQKNENVVVKTKEDVVIQKNEDVVVQTKEDVIIQKKEDVVLQTKEEKSTNLGNEKLGKEDVKNDGTNNVIVKEIEKRESKGVGKKKVDKVKKDDLEENSQVLKVEPMKKKNLTKKTKNKIKKDQKIKNKIKKLKEEYEKINAYIPSNTLKRLKEKEERKKLRKESEKNPLKKPKIKTKFKKKPTKKPGVQKSASKSVNKKPKKDNKEKSNKSTTPRKRANTGKTQKNIQKNQKPIGDTGSNYYALMLENHHNKLYSGPQKSNPSKMIEELKRFSKTNKKFGINDEILTWEGKHKMGLDKVYKAPVMPIKMSKRVRPNGKPNNGGIKGQNNTSLHNTRKEWKMLKQNQGRSKSHTNFNEKKEKAVSLYPREKMRRKLKTAQEISLKDEVAKDIWNRYRSKAKSLSPNTRRIDHTKPVEFRNRNKEFDHDVANLIIQKRKIIKMKYELLRMENLLERETKLRKIRNLEEKEEEKQKTERHILFKKIRETANAQIQETNKFLKLMDKLDWASQDKLISSVKNSLKANMKRGGQAPIEVKTELRLFAKELKKEGFNMESKISELRKKMELRDAKG
jgi:hypothetical protein